MYDCESNKEDCIRTTKQFSVCSVCKRVAWEDITIEVDQDDPIDSRVFSQAVEEFTTRYWDRLSESPYSFDGVLKTKTFRYRDHGEDNTWVYVFSFKEKK